MQNNPYFIITTELMLVVGAIAVWSILPGAFFYFRWRVAPFAFRRWAEEQGFRVIEQAQAGSFDWFPYSMGVNQYRVYRIVVEDKIGRIQAGLVRVGNPFYLSLSRSRCPVEARWDEQHLTP